MKQKVLFFGLAFSSLWTIRFGCSFWSGFLESSHFDIESMTFGFEKVLIKLMLG